MALAERAVCSLGYLAGAAGFLGVLLWWLNNGFTQSAKAGRVAKGMVALGAISFVATWLAER